MMTVVILLVNSNPKNRGSATVFLLLIFIVILSLIIALISILTYHSEQINASRTLNLSLESVFSKYYKPLFDDYRLFYLVETDNDIVGADAMTCFMKNQEGISPLLKIEPSNLDISEKYYATEDGAENVMNQIKTQVKYSLADNAVQALFDKFKACEEQTEDCSQQIEDISSEVKSNEDAAKLESEILCLLKIIEGITVTGDTINSTNCYVKQGIAGEVTPVNAGIDSKKVWKAIKSKCWDITELPKQLADISSNNSSVLSDYPSSDIAKWTNRICRLKEKTDEAFKMAQKISKQQKLLKNDECICDVTGFCSKLSDNIIILDDLISFGKYSLPNTEEARKEYNAQVLEVLKNLKTYHISDLCFDYSTLCNNEGDNPLEKDPMKSNSLLKLILKDNNNISNKSIGEACVYEKLIEQNESSNANKEENIQSNENKNSRSVEVTQYYDCDELNGFLKECKGVLSVDSAKESLILNAYIELFFNSFIDYEDGNKNDVECALQYEKEYMIKGLKSDYDNLEAATKKIQILRAAETFAYLVFNKKLSGEAYAAAAALVGFTGMDALVQCVKFMILAVWSYEDACIDTGAILQRMNIPLIKNYMNISFAEMFKFGRKLVQQKIKKHTGNKGVNYDFYLQIFLAAMPIKTRLYRSMDIIQENMKLRYDNIFSFQRALYGVDISMTCISPYYGEYKAQYRYR